MCKTERFEKEITVEDYLEGYVAVDEFLEYCRACPNFEKIWACPTYDFDVIGYWRQFRTLRVFARKIYLSGVASQSETEALLQSVKEDMSRELFALEEEVPGSVSLSAGSCTFCGEEGCTRPQGEPCRYPEKMRYSIESLGGNVGLTCRKLMGINLEWMEEGKLPSYFVLCAGLLMK